MRLVSHAIRRSTFAGRFIYLPFLLLLNSESCDDPCRAVDTNSTEQRIQKALGAKNSSENLAAYKNLFNLVENGEISTLKHHRNVGIGIRMAWEEILRKLPKEDKGGPAQPIDSRLLHYFVGFIEGRVDCELPSWWKETLLSAHVNKRDDVRFTLPQKAFIDTKKDGLFGRIVPNLKAGDPLVLVTGKQKIIIPSSTVENMETCDFASFVITGKRVYVAWHLDAAASYKQYCVDRQSGMILWGTKVWADGGNVFYGGIGSHVVALVDQKECLIVLGASESCIYLEAFDKDNGKNLYRFSTGY